MVTAQQAHMLLGARHKLKPQPSDDWQGDFPLPETVVRYYWEIGPSNVTIDMEGNPFFLPSLRSLWKFQDGYRFVGRERQRETSWDDDWLVVADQGGDPLIVSRSSGAVFFAEHGAGVWEPETVFANLNEMAACLALLGRIVDDDAFEVRSKLAVLLNSDSEADRVMAVLVC